MTYSELKRLLKKNGCRFSLEGKKHEIWYSEKTVGRHDTQEVATGTLTSILKDAGLK